MIFRASAPGKLVLLGEYSVLEGAPALVMAVDRRATVELVPVQSENGSVSAPEIWPDTESFAVDADGSPLWLNHDPRLTGAMSLVSCVMRAFGASGRSQSTSFHLTIRSDSFFQQSNDSRTKLGLGSSAAVTAALSSVLVARAGRFDMLSTRQSWISELVSVHRMFQHGRGSGLDIAAAIYGGLIRYQLRTSPRVTRLEWPPGLFRLWVWSGRSASTADYLANLEVWKKDRPEAYRRHMCCLAEIAEHGVQAACRSDAGALLQSISEGALALQAFGDASRIPIFSPRHQKIGTLVKKAGGIYKPCGAGGGDFGLAVTQEAAIAVRIKAVLQSEGYAVLEFGIDEAGLTLDQVSEEL